MTPAPAPNPNSARWLLFFYSVPSKPVSSRMTVWRRLMKAGAVPLKGAVYILPFNADRHEFLLWLAAEVKALSGDGAVVSIDRVDTLADEEIVALFTAARLQEYQPVEQDADALSRKIDNLKKGGQGGSLKGLVSQLDKVAKACAEVRKTDFFSSAKGVHLTASIEEMRDELARLSGPRPKDDPAETVRRKAAADYQGRLWVTRKRPFVDRMACAWLIRHAIDPAARFGFIDEGTMASLPDDAVAFDMPGAEFTHAGHLCTFEVLLRAFSLKEKALWRLAEAVHDLDMKDGKYDSPEAAGIEQMLSGIRKTAADDQAALSRGMEVFALLHASHQ